MKRFLLSVSAVAIAMMMSAAPRSLSDAQAVANKFLTSDANRVMRMAPNSQRLKLAHTALQTDQKPAFYVFNNGDNNGFVLVSADDNAREVLGYSETGSFNEADMPENMRVWFQHYAEEIAWAAANGKNFRQQTPKRAVSPVSPLLQTKWNQDKPYNNLCPTDQTDNTKAATGCVATAAAQIMKYWNHPVQGVGSHTDNWDNSGAYSDYQGKGKGSEFADFGATTYDWDNMLNSYKGSYNETQAKAVATLMYHVGISCDMTYGGDAVRGSGALTTDMAKALYTYFKYDKSLKYIMMDYTGYDKFVELFIEELEAGRPILMGGATKNYEGHEFVCDGVDKDGLFHINWGWGGMSDDYFVLSALDPDQQGIGGAASKNGFTVQVEAVIGIKPDEGGALSAPLVTVEPDQDGNYDYKFSKTAAKKSETIKFSTQQAYNSGPAEITNAPVVFAVYKQDSTFLQAFGSDKFSMEAMSKYYSALSVSANFNGLAAGEYLMALAFRMDDSQDWTQIGIYDIGTFCDIHVTADSIYIKDFKSEGSGGGSTDVEGNLDVDSGWFWYDTDSKKWELILTNSGYAPVVSIFFNSSSNNKVSGEYNIGTNAEIYPDWDEYEYSWYGMGTPTVTSKSGTLKVVRRSEEDSKGYSLYEIWLEFKGDDNQTYTLHGSIWFYAMDYNDNDISLQDEVVEEPTEIETVVSDSPAAIKTFQNGHIVIKVDGRTYNIIGAQIQ